MLARCSLRLVAPLRVSCAVSQRLVRLSYTHMGGWGSPDDRELMLFTHALQAEVEVPDGELVFVAQKSVVGKIE